MSERKLDRMQRIAQSILLELLFLKDSVCGKVISITVDEKMFEVFRHLLDYETFVNGEVVAVPCEDEVLKVLGIDIVRGVEPKKESKMNEPMSKFLKWTRFCDCGRPIAGIIVDAAGNTVEAHKNEGLWVVETPRGAQLVNPRPLGDGEDVAEAERPKPKFEVGQWVECMDDTKYRGVVVHVDGQRVILRDPYGPAEASRKYPHWVQPVDSVTPCSPVCTGAQLAIRVGDEVKVTGNWRFDGKPRGGRDKYQDKTGKVTGIVMEGCIFVTVISADIPAEKFNIWNLEPVNPRA